MLCGTRNVARATWVRFVARGSRASVRWGTTAAPLAGLVSMTVGTVVLGHPRLASSCEAPHALPKRNVEAPPSRPEVVNEGSDYTVFQREQTDVVESSNALTSNFQDLLAAASDEEVNVLLLGEVHDDGVAHRLQLQVLEHCAEQCRVQGRRLILSLEMFETDVQRVLDEYVLQRGIREEDFLHDARAWGNYKTDYRPLVEFCRRQGVRVIAANAPRRYVSLTAREGSAGLKSRLNEAGANSDDLGLPPLPLPPASAAYRQKFVETMASQMPAASAEQSDGCPYIGFKSEDVRAVKPEMLEAQLLWDHTMAQSVARAGRPEGGGEPDPSTPLVVHVCGAFHCAHGLGIPEVLPRYSAGGVEVGATACEPHLWLPIDGAAGAADRKAGSSADVAGVKLNPPGVLSVIMWPASVAGTLKMVQSGSTPRSLSLFGDWVVITEELWGEQQ